MATGDWTWKQAVADRAVALANHKSSPTFVIDDLYTYFDEFSALFPRNQHVKEKIHQTLGY